MKLAKVHFTQADLALLRLAESGWVEDVVPAEGAMHVLAHQILALTPATDAQRWLDYWTIGTGAQTRRTPGGLIFVHNFGSIRYATNAGAAWRFVRVAPATYSDTAITVDLRGSSVTTLVPEEFALPALPPLEKPADSLPMDEFPKGLER